MESLDGIRARMRSAIDLNWYDSRYALQIWMSGYYDQCVKAGGLSVMRQEGNRHSLYELPDYRTLQPEFEGTGLQNHGLVNSRINVQGVVTAKPKFIFKVDDPVQRGVLESYIEESWQDGGWDMEFFNAGMEVETCGIGAAVCGIDEDGGTAWVHTPLMDTLFDRAYRSPAQWRWLAYRVRIPLDDAIDQFGDYIEREGTETVEQAMKAYSRKRLVPMGGHSVNAGGIDMDMNIQDDVVHCWYYWDRDNHTMFVGSPSEQAGVRTLNLTWQKSGYKPSEKAGKNVYGVVPSAYWIDSWAPGVDRPSAKSETTIRLASMLNELEYMMVRAIRNSLPLPVIDASRCSQETAEYLKKVVASGATFNLKDLNNLIVIEGGNVKEILQRLDPIDLPQIWRDMRSQLKEEMNAATGVQDMMRGQALTGEKTKYEVQQLMDSAGVQARHMRNQYGRFLVDVASVTFAVAAVGDDKSRTLYLDDGPLPIGEGGFPLAPFVKKKVPCSVDTSSLVYKTDEDIKNEVIAELKGLIEPGLQAGVVNTYRAFLYLFRKWGHRDATVIMNTATEMQQAQQSKAMAAQAQAHGQMKELIQVAVEKLPPDIQQQIFTQFFGLQPSQMLGQPQQPPPIDPNALAQSIASHATAGAQANADHQALAMKEAAATHRQVLSDAAATHREIVKARVKPPPPKPAGAGAKK